MTYTVRAQRVSELRALIERAVAKEASLSDDARRRIVNLILRQSDRIADIGEGLRASAPVAVSESAAAAPSSSIENGFEHVFEPAFDPYATGAVESLQRLGPAALMDSLCTITSVENLVSLARAQNLSLKAGWSNADELRAAIVSCAEQRLEERRAAAILRSSGRRSGRVLYPAVDRLDQRIVALSKEMGAGRRR